MKPPVVRLFLGVQLLCAASSVGAQPASAQSAAAPLPLAAVEVTGAKRYTPAEVVRATGLEPGKAVTSADFDAATKRMAESGLFKEISYRYVTAAGRTTVTFAIDEADWTMPVVFDNFVWFTDDEIVQALRQRVPSFDGTAPTLAGIPEMLTRELQALLESKQIKGRVEFIPQGTLQSLETYVFTVKDSGVKVCAVRFPGATVIKESELVDRLAIVGSDYSRAFILGASRGTLGDMYRERGHWRASLGRPTARVEQGPACSGGGVTVTVPVEEGPTFVTERIV